MKSGQLTLALSPHPMRRGPSSSRLLLEPGRINAYVQAVIQTMQADEHELSSAPIFVLTNGEVMGNPFGRPGLVRQARAVNYKHIITIEPAKRGGKPRIRRMRITVADVLGWLASGMSHQEIIEDFPELTEEDIRACLAYAADRERQAKIVVAAHETPV